MRENLIVGMLVKFSLILIANIAFHTSITNINTNKATKFIYLLAHSIQPVTTHS